MSSRYAALSRAELATLVPELLLGGQLIDRSGMAWCIQAFGREQMTQIAIEEWMAASPIYTQRMQRALGYTGNDVITIFKGLQLDIGAPPQFMDFRYTVHDRWHGEFQLDHCGALMDVEPMGDDYVTAMCHDVEDPTFDATAIATNPKAQIRPVHRPPRRPADRHPHCAWTVIIDDSHTPVVEAAATRDIRAKLAGHVELDPIDPSDEGHADYSGPLLSDLVFGDFSHSALVRIADEVCLQMHLLNLGFIRAVGGRTDAAELHRICTNQLIGIAGVIAERLARAFAVPADEAGALRVLALHPLLNPAAYVDATVGGAVIVRRSSAHDDGAWISLVGPDSPEPLQAIVQAVDPYLDVAIEGTATDWTARLIRGEEPAKVPDPVTITRFSSGVGFQFEPRRALPLAVGRQVRAAGP